MKAAAILTAALVSLPWCRPSVAAADPPREVVPAHYGYRSLPRHPYVHGYVPRSGGGVFFYFGAPPGWGHHPSPWYERRWHRHPGWRDDRWRDWDPWWFDPWSDPRPRAYYGFQRPDRGWDRDWDDW